MEDKITKGDVLYYARIFPQTATYEVDEICIRTVTDTYFVGTEKRTKQAFLFGFNELGESVFREREDALALVKEAEKNKKKLTTEYEEY